MIYFKRFLFGIITFCSLLFAVIGTILFLLIFPIIGFIYYIVTGKDPMREDEDFGSFCWDYAIKFIDWCRLKLNLE